MREKHTDMSKLITNTKYNSFDTSNGAPEPLTDYLDVS